MDKSTLQFLNALSGDLTERFYHRALALERIAALAPVGRRLLSQQMQLPEREVRTLCDALREDGLIRADASGMTITEKASPLIDGAREMVRCLGGTEALEKELTERLDIRSVYIVPGNADETGDVLRQVGRMAAQRLRPMLENGMILTVSGGSTMAAVAAGMHSTSPISVHVLPARGGMGRAVETQASTIAQEFAKALGASYSPLHLPDAVTPDALKELIKLPEISEPLGAMHRTDLLLYGIGRAEVMARNRALPEDEVRGILSMGAVAEAVGCYFDSEGHMVFQASGVGLGERQLSSIPRIVAVAAGSGKARAILAVARHHRHELLVTDEGAARAILSILREEASIRS